MASDRALVSHMEGKRAEILADVAAMVERRLSDYAVSKADAESIGNDVADMLADAWGGQNFTIPKDWQRKLGIRDLEIYNAWRHGGTFDALAREHKMSERGVRKLVARVRERLARARDKQQMQLLD